MLAGGQITMLADEFPPVYVRPSVARQTAFAFPSLFAQQQLVVVHLGSPLAVGRLFSFAALPVWSAGAPLPSTSTPALLLVLAADQSADLRAGSGRRAPSSWIYLADLAATRAAPEANRPAGCRTR